ncbi:riboflavin synthase [Candidatus Symbiobacter mobilis]|uniref:Riboflavin synthase n=1 Tax=Candidatus Symbiobacter mobilis CR TaxID=946483 RepID=U5N7I7_9BURK|nr:riboflavin synthase [Candidatus Symbiobacter mobilis]AGX87280.1 riboflavin synthase subunit alpha [Candidatus Symbiobacter mobilis CR]
MFTGIITAIGHIVHAAPPDHPEAQGLRLVLSCPPGYLEDVVPGDSIALNGACMTVCKADATASRFTVDVSAESLDKTTGFDNVGTPVHLEKALRLQDRLGGHLVSGHVDAVGRVLRCEPVGEGRALHVLAPPHLGKFLAVKGSVCIHGVSLTINGVADQPEGCAFHVHLIPHTLHATALDRLQPGSTVNLEIDLIARYVERMRWEEAPSHG